MSDETYPTTPRAAGDGVVDFTLSALDGKTYSSKTARQEGMLLTTLFKVGCGTCRYALPFLQRFHEQYAQPSGGRFKIWGVSQDNAEDTQAFAQEYGNATFPMLLDKDLDVSARFGLTNVPDLYLLDSGNAVSAAVLGHFAKDEFNDLARKVAGYLNVPYVPVVREEDDAPDLKPG